MIAAWREIDRFSALNIDGYLAKTVAADRLLTLLRQVMQGEFVIETDAVPSPALPASDTTRPTYGLTKREVAILKGVKQVIVVGR